jgi:hypothetical protein
MKPHSSDPASSGGHPASICSIGPHSLRGLSLIAALVAILIAGGLYLGYEWYKVKDVKMSERPERLGSTQPLAPMESSVVASISVSHATLQTVLNGIAHKLAGSKSDSEDIRCVSSNFPRIRECLTANWDVTYSAGSIGVSKAGELVKVTLPVEFSGGAGFGGGIANALSVGRKSIDGAAVVSASLSASLDERFCPVLTVKDTEFSWTREARIEVIGRSRVFGLFNIGPEYLNVGRHFNGPVREALKKAAEEAGRAIPCDPVRAEVAKIWKRYSVPLATEGQPTLYLNAWPEKAGSSGLLSEDTGIRIVLMLTGKAAVETSAGQTTPLGDLPTHVKLPAQPGQLNLAVPIRVEYAKLREAVNTALSSQSFDQDTAAGKVSIKLLDFEFFPSDKRVAVGVKFRADAPTGIFDTQGTVWLLARPEVGADGKTVRLTEVDIYRKIDNETVKVLTAIFEGQINKAIAEAAYYDLRKDEQTLVASLEKAISDPTKTGGVRLTIRDPSIQFGRITVEDNALALEGLFNAVWDAEVRELKL